MLRAVKSEILFENISKLMGSLTASMNPCLVPIRVEATSRAEDGLSFTHASHPYAAVSRRLQSRAVATPSAVKTSWF